MIDTKRKLNANLYFINLVTIKMNKIVTYYARIVILKYYVISYYLRNVNKYLLYDDDKQMRKIKKDVHSTMWIPA